MLHRYTLSRLVKVRTMWECLCIPGMQPRGSLEQTMAEPASTLTGCSEPAKKLKDFAMKEVRNDELSLVHMSE